MAGSRIKPEDFAIGDESRHKVVGNKPCPCLLVGVEDRTPQSSRPDGPVLATVKLDNAEVSQNRQVVLCGLDGIESLLEPGVDVQA